MEQIGFRTDIWQGMVISGFVLCKGIEKNCFIPIDKHQYWEDKMLKNDS